MAEKTFESIPKIKLIEERADAYLSLVDSAYDSKYITKELFLTLKTFLEKAKEAKDVMTIETVARIAKVEIKAGKQLKELSDTKKFLIKLLNMLVSALKKALK